MIPVYEIFDLIYRSRHLHYRSNKIDYRLDVSCLHLIEYASKLFRVDGKIRQIGQDIGIWDNTLTLDICFIQAKGPGKSVRLFLGIFKLTVLGQQLSIVIELIGEITVDHPECSLEII